MRQLLHSLIAFGVLLNPALSQNTPKPFLGRWDFNITTPTGPRASWLGVSEKNGHLDIWFQPTGGNVRRLNEGDFKMTGSHLSLSLEPVSTRHPALSWELDAAGDQLTGVQKQGSDSIALTGVRAPDLKRNAPAAWSAPEPLFNGKNLDGWEPVGDVEHSHWTVKDGLLVNEQHGANLRTTGTFTDFKLHFEVNCPEDANSGFYLRGRYELQIESEPLSKNPPERRIGSIYGRIAPTAALPRIPGKWQTFDVTLVGRTVTVAQDGVTTIDRQQIDGITGGALDANEGDPGPFYIQGDHTGGLKFRNITVAVPQ